MISNDNRKRHKLLLLYNLPSVQPTFQAQIQMGSKESLRAAMMSPRCPGPVLPYEAPESYSTTRGILLWFHPSPFVPYIVTLTLFSLAFWPLPLLLSKDVPSYPFLEKAKHSICGYCSPFPYSKIRPSQWTLLNKAGAGKHKQDIYSSEGISSLNQEWLLKFGSEIHLPLASDYNKSPLQSRVWNNKAVFPFSSPLPASSATKVSITLSLQTLTTLWFRTDIWLNYILLCTPCVPEWKEVPKKHWMERLL